MGLGSIFNDYGDRAFLTRAGKDVLHLFHVLRTRLDGNEPTKYVVAYPQYPSRFAAITSFCNYSGAIKTNRLRNKPSAIIFWKDQTTRILNPELAEYARESGQSIVNGRCLSIDKGVVDAAMQLAFGYCTKVDPVTQSGRIVRKSRTNAKHDGEILEGPILPEDIDEGSIYQILIDNSFQRDLVLDLRVPVFRNRTTKIPMIPCVIKKYRRISERFRNTTVNVEVVDPYSVFSQAEISSIFLFCDEIGLDFGELDILRDNNSGQIFVIDANSTPYSPPRGASKAVKQTIVATCAPAIDACFFG